MGIFDQELPILKAALRPFAEAAPCYPADFSPTLIVVPAFHRSVGILVADFRRAASAYESGDRQSMVQALEYFAVLSDELWRRLSDDVVTWSSGQYWRLPANGPKPAIRVKDIHRAAHALASCSRSGRSILLPADRQKHSLPRPRR